MFLGWAAKNRCLNDLSRMLLPLLVVGIAGFAAADTPSGGFTNGIGMEFVYIPAGTFLMGSPVDEFRRDDDENLHPVRLTRGFYMQVTEVSQRQWRTLMGADPSKYTYCGGDCPVDNVSWADVQIFIEKMNRADPGRTYRLPTEAEWEYACRADTTTPFYFGDQLHTDQANYNGNHPIPGSERGVNRNTTLPVGSFPPNGYGLFDMHGNVYEWCSDWYGPYPQGLVTDPQGPQTGVSRVSRGGGMSSYARRCRSANRTKHLPSYQNFYIGFRLVCESRP